MRALDVRLLEGRALPWRLLACLLLALATTRVARAGGALEGFENAFRRAVRDASGATVVLVAEGADPEQAGHSSGVLVSADGLVLSDGDAGLVTQAAPARERARRDRVEVHVPSRAGAGHATHAARLLARDVAADVSLWRIEAPPPGGFPHLTVGTSGGLEVGDFVFAAGSSVDDPQAVAPAVTSGILAARTPLPVGDPGGRDAHLFVTAAVNPGTNGGPLLDVRGRCVGIVSTQVAPGGPDEPFQLLGKVVPSDRIRGAFAGVAEAEPAFAAATTAAPAGPEAAHALERTFRRAAGLASPFVVSLEVERTTPLDARSPLGAEVLSPPRYAGPVSGVAVSRDGWIVTSLYNLTNISTLMDPLWRAPPGAGLAEGLEAVRSITAHYRGGPSVPARLVAHDPRLGIALVKADLEGASPPEGADGAFAPALFTPASGEAYRVGRFLLALGHPFGAAPPPDPLLAYGILSKRHPDDAAAPWRGQWQADVSVTDANAGGAVVDLEGRFVGLLTIWSGVQHGRNSGIAFVVPWGRIQRALPDLKEGRVPARGRLGVRFEPGGFPRVSEVVAGSPAATAGVRVGDLLLVVDRTPVLTTSEATEALAHRWAGDRAVLKVRRAGKDLRLPVVLGAAAP